MPLISRPDTSRATAWNFSTSPARASAAPPLISSRRTVLATTWISRLVMASPTIAMTVLRPTASAAMRPSGCTETMRGAEDDHSTSS
jgi:hypothetical protein